MVRPFAKLQRRASTGNSSLTTPMLQQDADETSHPPPKSSGSHWSLRSSSKPQRQRNNNNNHKKQKTRKNHSVRKEENGAFPRVPEQDEENHHPVVVEDEEEEDGTSHSSYSHVTAATAPQEVTQASPPAASSKSDNPAASSQHQERHHRRFSSLGSITNSIGNRRRQRRKRQSNPDEKEEGARIESETPDRPSPKATKEADDDHRTVTSWETPQRRQKQRHPQQRRLSSSNASVASAPALIRGSHHHKDGSKSKTTTRRQRRRETTNADNDDSNHNSNNNDRPMSSSASVSSSSSFPWRPRRRKQQRRPSQPSSTATTTPVSESLQKTETALAAYLRKNAETLKQQKMQQQQQPQQQQQEAKNNHNDDDDNSSVSSQSTRSQPSTKRSTHPKQNRLATMKPFANPPQRNKARKSFPASSSSNSSLPTSSAAYDMRTIISPEEEEDEREEDDDAFLLDQSFSSLSSVDSDSSAPSTTTQGRSSSGGGGVSSLLTTISKEQQSPPFLLDSLPVVDGGGQEELQRNKNAKETDESYGMSSVSTENGKEVGDSSTDEEDEQPSTKPSFALSLSSSLSNRRQGTLGAFPTCHDTTLFQVQEEPPEEEEEEPEPKSLEGKTKMKTTHVSHDDDEEEEDEMDSVDGSIGRPPALATASSMALNKYGLVRILDDSESEDEVMYIHKRSFSSSSNEEEEEVICEDLNNSDEPWFPEEETTPEWSAETETANSGNRHTQGSPGRRSRSTSSSPHRKVNSTPPKLMRRLLHPGTYHRLDSPTSSDDEDSVHQRPKDEHVPMLYKTSHATNTTFASSSSSCSQSDSTLIPYTEVPTFDPSQQAAGSVNNKTASNHSFSVTAILSGGSAPTSGDGGGCSTITGSVVSQSSNNTKSPSNSPFDPFVLNTSSSVSPTSWAFSTFGIGNKSFTDNNEAASSPGRGVPHHLTYEDDDDGSLKSVYTRSTTGSASPSRFKTRTIATKAAEQRSPSRSSPSKTIATTSSIEVPSGDSSPGRKRQQQHAYWQTRPISATSSTASPARKRLFSSSSPISSSSWADKVVTGCFLAMGMTPLFLFFSYRQVIFQSLFARRTTISISEILTSTNGWRFILLASCSCFTSVCCTVMIWNSIALGRNILGQTPGGAGSPRTTNTTDQLNGLERQYRKLMGRLDRRKSQQAQYQSRLLAAQAKERLLQRRTKLVQAIKDAELEIKRRQQEQVIWSTVKLILHEQQTPQQQLKNATSSNHQNNNNNENSNGRKGTVSLKLKNLTHKLGKGWRNQTASFENDKIVLDFNSSTASSTSVDGSDDENQNMMQHDGQDKGDDAVTVYSTRSTQSMPVLPSSSGVDGAVNDPQTAISNTSEFNYYYGEDDNSDKNDRSPTTQQSSNQSCDSTEDYNYYYDDSEKESATAALTSGTKEEDYNHYYGDSAETEPALPTVMAPPTRRRAQRRNSTVILPNEMNSLLSNNNNQGEGSLPTALVKTAALFTNDYQNSNDQGRLEEPAETMSPTTGSQLKDKNRQSKTTPHFFSTNKNKKLEEPIHGETVLNDMAMKWLFERWMKVPGVVLSSPQKEPKEQRQPLKNKTNAKLGQKSKQSQQQTVWTVSDLLRLTVNASQLQYQRPSLRFIREQRKELQKNIHTDEKHKADKEDANSDDSLANKEDYLSSSAEEDVGKMNGAPGSKSVPSSRPPTATISNSRVVSSKIVPPNTVNKTPRVSNKKKASLQMAEF